jgi:hypothetical protein
MHSMLQERVRLLCDRAIFAKTRAELDAVLPELQTAIRDHIRYVRAIGLETIPEAFSSHERSRAFDGTLASIDFEQDLIKLLVRIKETSQLLEDSVAPPPTAGVAHSLAAVV